MGQILHKFLSLCMALWYLACIVGFDLHICSSTGENYVATFVNGITCTDIHPDDMTQHHTCCSGCCGCVHDHEMNHHNSDSFTRKPCCTDDYQSLLLTGTDTGQRHQHKYLYCAFGLLPRISQVLRSIEMSCRPCVNVSDFSPSCPDVQSLFSVWRI